MVKQLIPVLLINKGGIDVNPPIKKYSKKVKNNNNKRSLDVTKKRNVKATASLLRTK
jgi:hypothetical protein